MKTALDLAVDNWKKIIRDTSRPLRYADSFREGWAAALDRECDCDTSLFENEISGDYCSLCGGKIWGDAI